MKSKRVALSIALLAAAMLISAVAASADDEGYGGVDAQPTGFVTTDAQPSGFGENRIVQPTGFGSIIIHVQPTGFNE